MKKTSQPEWEIEEENRLILGQGPALKNRCKKSQNSGLLSLFISTVLS